MPNVVNNAARRELKNVLDMVSIRGFPCLIDRFDYCPLQWTTYSAPVQSDHRLTTSPLLSVRTDSVQSSFDDFYELTGEILGEGAYAKVQGCIHKETGKEYAVKTIIKHAGLSRARVFKEIELFYHCQGHKNIIQLIEFFEEEDRFFLIFEKINGGPLLDHIQKRVQFTENEASLIIKDLASALKFIHGKGIAHR